MKSIFYWNPEPVRSFVRSSPFFRRGGVEKTGLFSEIARTHPRTRSHLRYYLRIFCSTYTWDRFFITKYCAKVEYSPVNLHHRCRCWKRMSCCVFLLTILFLRCFLFFVCLFFLCFVFRPRNKWIPAVSLCVTLRFLSTSYFIW